MRNKLTCMLLVLLAFCLPFSAYAKNHNSSSSPVVETGFDVIPVASPCNSPVTFPVIRAGFPYENKIHLLTVGEVFEEPQDEGYRTATVYYQKDKWSPLQRKLPIAWDFEQIDSSTPGLYTLDGVVELANDLIPDEDVYPDGIVTVPLSYYVYDPEDSETKLAIQGVYQLNGTQYHMNLGEDVRQLKLPDKAYGYYVAGTLRGSAQCAISWDYDSFDSSVVGKQTLYGEIVAPEAFLLDKNSQAEGQLRVKCQIVVSDTQGSAQTVIIAGYGYMGNRYRIIPLDMSRDVLLDTFEKRMDPSLEFLFVDEAMNYFFCDYDIDTSQIDTSQAGMYYPISLINFPAYTIFDQTVKDMTAVYVIDPNAVDLRCFAYDPFEGELTASWIYIADAPELWVSVDSGDWQAADEDSYIIFSYDDEPAQEFILDVTTLTPGHHYDFEVRYDNDQYSLNTVVVDLSDGMLAVYDTPVDGNRHGYDREDGEDNTPGNGDDNPPSSGGGNTTDNGGGESGSDTPDASHHDDAGHISPMATADDPHPLALPVSVMIEEVQPPAAGIVVVSLEDKNLAVAQADPTKTVQPSEPEPISSTPEQSPLHPPAVEVTQLQPQIPAEDSTTRSEPVSPTLLIALGSSALICGAGFLWLRKRIKL